MSKLRLKINGYEATSKSFDSSANLNNVITNLLATDETFQSWGLYNQVLGQGYLFSATDDYSIEPSLPVIEDNQSKSFEYAITSWSATKTSSVIIVLTIDGTSEELSYSDSFSPITKSFKSTASMSISYTSSDGSISFTVRKNGTAISDYSNISLSNNDSIDITWYSSCLTGDCLITLADGTQKAIKDLVLEDKVLGYNPDTLELESQDITELYNDENAYDDSFTRFYFSNGTTVDIVQKHAFYNADIGTISSINNWPLGSHVKTINGGMPSLIKIEEHPIKTRYYTLFTTYQNYFVNGILAGNRFTKRLYFDLYQDNNKEGNS